MIARDCNSDILNMTIVYDIHDINKQREMIGSLSEVEAKL